jgi:uncharacterized damage-inducible protein DinB
MPMTVPPVTDERQALLAFLAQQRAAVRNACYGLTDQQARETSTASTLSLGGLVNHLAQVERDWTQRITTDTTQGPHDPEAEMAHYFDGFRLADGETLAGVLHEYEEAAAGTDVAVSAIEDLGRPVPLPEAPWFPAGDCTVRWALVHMIEETARHAGHADILRESLDGASAGALMAAAEGWPEDGWVKPWQPPAA